MSQSIERIHARESETDHPRLGPPPQLVDELLQHRAVAHDVLGGDALLTAVEVTAPHALLRGDGEVRLRLWT